MVSNLLLMGAVLRMDKFSKDQQVDPTQASCPPDAPLSQTIALESLRRQVGTYCIACAILTLPDVGPSDQPDLDVLWLVQQ